MGIGNLLSYCFPNKALDKAETLFQRTQFSIILNWNEDFSLICFNSVLKNKTKQKSPLPQEIHYHMEELGQRE